MDQLLIRPNGTTRFWASWPISARPPNAMPERPHQSPTMAVSSAPNSTSLGSRSPTRPSRKRADFSHGRRRGQMEHRSIDRIEMLADLLDQELDPGEVRFERGSQQVRQHGQVERHGRLLERGLQCCGVAADEPIERALNRRRPFRQAVIAAKCILGHRPPGDAQSGLVEAGEQEARIAIAHVELASQRRRADRQAPPRRSGSNHSRRERTTRRQPKGPP